MDLFFEVLVPNAGAHLLPAAGAARSTAEAGGSQVQRQTVSKPSTEGFPLFPAPTRLPRNSAWPFLGRGGPHDHTAPRP
jgi:hypothetical protein